MNELIVEPPTAESVLASIVEAASEARGRAALSHYPSRRIWANRLHDELNQQLTKLTRLEEQVRSLNSIQSRPTTKRLFAVVIPVLLNHHTALLQKLPSVAAPIPQYRMGDSGIERSYQQFNDLLNACRQYVDSTVQDSYQLTELSPEEFNYSVLSSLSSFLQLAPPSLQVPFLTEKLLNAVVTFEKDRNQKFANSKVRRFHELAKRLASQLAPSFVPDAKTFLERIFRFSSDFAHAGFISSLVTMSEPGGVYLGGPDGVFFASTENYAEIQYLVLKSCLFTYSDIYLRAVRKAVASVFSSENLSLVLNEIDSSMSTAKIAFKSTGLQLHAWVSNDAMNAKRTIW